MKRARDSQRLSDLSTVQTAIGYYLTNISSPSIGGSTTSYTHYATVTKCDGAGVSVGTTSQAVDETGWIPINFATLTSGSPIPSLPIDPTNTNGYHYWYLCDSIDYTFELLAHLESTQYASKYLTDGGKLDDMYEVGTKMIAATSTGCT
ncbi:MAG: hypothetical protein NTW64_07505 [Candidatus Omnitrophica bacterium]|nr:hypothetical protein [Candidatus Omnitrophota bacterium]